MAHGFQVTEWPCTSLLSTAPLRQSQSRPGHPHPKLPVWPNGLSLMLSVPDLGSGGKPCTHAPYDALTSCVHPGSGEGNWAG